MALLGSTRESGSGAFSLYGYAKTPFWNGNGSLYLKIDGRQRICFVWSAFRLCRCVLWGSWGEATAFSMRVEKRGERREYRWKRVTKSWNTNTMPFSRFHLRLSGSDPYRTCVRAYLPSPPRLDNPRLSLVLTTEAKKYWCRPSTRSGGSNYQADTPL